MALNPENSTALKSFIIWAGMVSVNISGSGNAEAQLTLQVQGIHEDLETDKIQLNTFLYLT